MSLRHLDRQFWLVSCIVAATVTFVAQRADAQTLSDPARITGAPSSIYDTSEIDNVDLTNGNLQIRIPLLHFPGRGIDTDILMSYNSKLWNSIQVAGDPDVWLINNDLDLDTPTSSPFGWRVGQRRLGALGRTVSTCLDPNCATGETFDEWYTPEGARIGLSNGYSFDGSYTLENIQGLVFKDGTRLTTAGLEDTNGNLITTGTNSSTQTYIRDTLGRMIYFNYSASPKLLQSITYLDSTGTSRTISFSYVVKTIENPYLGSGACGTTGLIKYNNTSLLSTITLPNGRTYQFQYIANSDGSSTAEITKITLPTGGYVRYSYGFGKISDDGSLTCFWRTNPPDLTFGQNRMVTARIVSSDGTAASEKTWTYASTTATPSQDGLHHLEALTLTDPLGNKTTVTRWFDFGVPVRVDHADSSGQVVRSTSYSNICAATSPYIPYGNESVCADPRVLSETTTLSDTNQQSKLTYAYDSVSNITEKDEYDWGAGAVGSLVRKTTNTYLSDSNTSYGSDGVHVLDRKTGEIVYDASGCARAQTTLSYDGAPLTATSGVVQHDYSGFPAGYALRGNVTQSSRWLSTGSTAGTCSTSGSWLSANDSYNDLGRPVQTTDQAGHVTQISYADNFYSFTPASPTLAYPTQQTSPNTGVAHVVRRQYYFNSGLPSAQCGENFPSASACAYGLTPPVPDYSSFSYDLMNRPLVANRGNGAQMTLSYAETSLPIKVTSTTTLTATISRTNQSTYDGLGQTTQTQLTSDPQGADSMDTTFDALGRVSTVSNPHRSTASPTDGITSTQYDALGRVTKVIPPDGTSSANNVMTAYSGNCTTVTDQSGKARKSCSDSLGRLTQVFEDPAGLNYETDYTYDVLNNLLTVNQKGGDPNSANWRPRTFTYNSLSQLTQVVNPESGTIAYTYDAVGNVTSRTSPAPNQTGSSTITVAYCYDQLNRLTSKAYTTSTTCPQTSPVATYTYDQSSANGITITNGIGRRTSMTDSAGTGLEAWSYDNMGRVLADKRTTNSVTKTTSYTYNLDGSIATLTYPSGRTITYTLASNGANSAGRMLSAVDTANSINYATAAAYAPPGALSSLTSGGTLVSTFYYNSRLQPCRLSAQSSGTAPTSCTDSTNVGNILDFSYNFSLGTANNGNVTAITNNGDTTRSPSFTYDPLNRILTAKTSSTSGTKCWDEQFGYDPWANLLSISRISGYTCSNEENLSVAVNTKNQPLGYTYDSAGNLINDGAGHAYTFNAENQLLTAGGVTYTYDGNGKRVQKSNGKLYWYGTGSSPLTETDTSGNPTSEYIFFNRTRTARLDLPSAAVHYYFSDHLGSASVVTSSAGAIQDESDYYPFGGERILANSDPNNYKFTGKERDSESGLDNFGARFDSSTLGRFVSVDPHNPIMIRQGMKAGGLPEAASDSFFNGFLDDPRNWNKYVYALDNPLRFTDPTGAAPQDGHHLIPEREKLGALGRTITDAFKTGRLSGNQWPNQPGFNAMHIRYNEAVKEMLNEAVERMGPSEEWSIQQWKDFASDVLKSEEPAIKEFLDELEENNPGAKAALATSIATYRVTASVIARVIVSSFFNTARGFLGTLILCVNCNESVTTRFLIPKKCKGCPDPSPVAYFYMEPDALPNLGTRKQPGQ